MNKSRLFGALSAFFLTSCVFTSTVAAVTLPVLSTFDTDVAGLPPNTGGINQPSSLFLKGGSSLLVQTQSNGINTQPIEASVDDTVPGVSNQAMAVYSFPTVATGLMRIEETVSIDKIGLVFFSQTVNSTNAVVTRPAATSSGELYLGGIIVGTYEVNVPFRFQMDIDLTNQLWFASVDNELDGFSDDPTFSGNQFANDFSGGLTFDISSAWFGALIGSSPATGPLVAAHDNISISMIPLPSAVYFFISGLLGLVGMARRKKV